MPQRLDLLGMAWQSREGLAAPVIYGNVAKSHAAGDNDIAGAWIGVVARWSSPDANVHEVEPSADSVHVERERGEWFYRGLEPSFVQRAARECGTSRQWLLVYRNA